MDNNLKYPSCASFLESEAAKRELFMDNFAHCLPIAIGIISLVIFIVLLIIFIVKLIKNKTQK